jgi:hypothetical protein
MTGERMSDRYRSALAVASLCVTLVASGAARADQPPPAPITEPPPVPAPASPLVAPTVPPAPVSAPPARPRRRWVAPVTIALEAGALGFAIASVAVLASGPTTDQWRVNLAGGLGGGTIACAAAGVVIGVILR